MKRRLFYLTALALAFGWADTASADSIVASARGDYVDGSTASDLAEFVATGSGTWTYVTSDYANPSDDSSLTTMTWDSANGHWFYAADTVPTIRTQGTGLQSDEIYICPSGLYNQPFRYGVARWTAGVGESGPTSIVGNVRSLDLSSQGGGVTFEIFVDGALEFSQVIVRDSVGESFNILATVDVGSTVDFVVGPNGYSDYDSTGLKATISNVSEPVPEPSTVAALIGMGVMGLAIAWRRRKRAA